MKDLGLRGISRTKSLRTTVPGTGPDTRPDLVERTFTAERPNRRECGADPFCQSARRA